MQPSLLLHAIVILTLIAVSIWDSILIINTYVNENRVTVVSTEFGNDSSKFLEKMHIHAFYHERDTVIPKAWLRKENISDVWTSDVYQNAQLDMQSGGLSIESIDMNSIDGLITGSSMFSKIYAMDYYGFECLESAPGLDACQADYFNATRNYGILFRNGTEIEELEQQLHERLFYNGSLKLNNGPVNSTHITIHSMNTMNVLFSEIHPQQLVETDTHNTLNQLSLRLVDDPTSFHLENNSRVYAYVVVLAERSGVVTLQIDPSRYYLVVITVKNLGIYDKTKTTECTWDPEIIPGNGNYFNYIYRDYLKTVVRKCECIPFSDKRHVRKFLSISSVVKNLPFCDYEKYKTCRTKYGPIRIEEEDSLPSCITVRNQYTVAINQETCVQKMCSFMDFRIVSTDHTYITYEDRYQITTPQLFSQLGGDIGLYTGLSLLSLWQVIAFVHGRYKRHKELGHSSKNSSNKKSTMAFVVELFKEIEWSLLHFGDKEKKPISSTDNVSLSVDQYGRRIELRHISEKAVEVMIDRKMEALVEKIRDMMAENNRALEDMFLSRVKPVRR